MGEGKGERMKKPARTLEICPTFIETVKDHSNYGNVKKKGGGGKAHRVIDATCQYFTEGWEYRSGVCQFTFSIHPLFMAG